MIKVLSCDGKCISIMDVQMSKFHRSRFESICRYFWMWSVEWFEFWPNGSINLRNKSWIIMNGLYEKDTFIAWCLEGWRVTLLLVKMIVRSFPFNSCKSQQNCCVCYLSFFVILSEKHRPNKYLNFRHTYFAVKSGTWLETLAIYNPANK